MSKQQSATWDRRQLADAIERTRRTSVYQGIGAHPVCLDDEHWKIVVEALRSEKTAPAPLTASKSAEGSALPTLPSARAKLTDEQIMNAACTAADALDATRVSEMVPGGWKATTIFEGDTGLLRFGRLIEKAINGK